MITTLAGKVALVTGGASGIGAACAREFARAGCRVAIADLALAPTVAAATGIGEDVLALEVDVRDEASCRRMVEATVARFGRLDIAVNNAGVGNKDRSRVADLSWTEWRKVTSVNLDGVFLSMKAEIAAMLTAGGGAIVNVSSVMGSVAVECGSAYVSAKHGVIGLTRAAALDYAKDGIRINAIGPGYVDTPMFGDRTPEQRAEVASRHPIGRIAKPEEIARVVAFLASPEAAFVTGAYYVADGGYTVK